LFETMLVVAGKIYDFASHIERLELGLKNLRIHLASDNLENICNQLINLNKIQNGCIRIIVSRGSEEGNNIGYLPKNSQAYFLVQAFERKYPEFKQVSLFVSSYKNHLNTQAKTNNSLLYTLAMLEAQENNCDNALLIGTDGNICETASGNIFWIKNNILYTPSDDSAIILGTMRKKIISLWQKEIVTGHFSLQDIIKADEIFMSNSGVIIAPVTKIIPLGINLSVGIETKRMRSLLDEDIKNATL